MVTDDDGYPVAISGAVLDVTDRKAIERSERDSQARLRDVLDCAPFAISLRDIDGRCRLFNRCASELIQENSETDLSGPADQFGAVDGEVGAPGEAVSYGVKARLADGIDRDWFVTRYPVTDADGDVIGTAEISLDFTDRQRAERDLCEAEERFRLAFDNAPIGIALIKPDLQWLRVNRAFCEITGYSEAELLVRSIKDITHPDDLELSLDCVRRVIAGEIDGYEIEKRYIRPDGTIVWILLSVSIVRGPNGEIRHSISEIQNIDERKRADARLRGLLETAPDAIVIVDENGVIVLVNAQTERLLGYDRDELVGESVELLIPARYRATYAEHRAGFLPAASGRAMSSRLELSACTKDGRELPVEISLSPLQTDDGMLVSAAMRDVTERRHAEETRRRLAAIVEQTHDAVVVISADGTIDEWNHSAERLFGYPPSEAIGMPVSVLIPLGHDCEEAMIMRSVLSAGHVQTLETVRLRKDGERVDVSMTVSPLRDPSGATVAVSVIARDISERKRLDGQLQHLADHDGLTGLFNRRRFEAELERELGRVSRDRSASALLLLDIDHFKYVNDSLGHAAGDQLIVQTAAVLRERLRQADGLGRFGGDEFAILLTGSSETAARLVACDLLAAIRSQSSIASPNGQKRITASIGIAAFAHGETLTADELLVRADIAMYDAKEAGRDRAAAYSQNTDRPTVMQTRLTWADRLRAAIDEQRFVLHAQPILSLTDDNAPRHELLIRMLNESGDPIAPASFLEVAERFDFIQEIDRWVLNEAIRLLADEQHAGHDVRLNVNISAKSLVDSHLARLVADGLDAADADGHGLCLEITETAAIVNVDRANRFASEIGKLGCKLALDDFGAGFASFYNLKHLTFDYLKIDGEFITGLAESHTNQLVVRSIVDIARGMGKRTIAEFVGDTKTLELLREYHVDYAQGYHITRPGPFSTGDLVRRPAFGTHPAVAECE